MAIEPTLDTVCAPSDQVVAREIEGEIIIVPLVAGTGDADADDELYTLNETGHYLWPRLDGATTLGEIAAALADEFDAPLLEIEADVLGFATEMAQLRILTVRA